MPKSSSLISGAIEDATLDLIRASGGLEAGEVVVHFDLVAITRRVENGREVVGRRHWTSVGSDPHMSYAALNAEAVRLLKQELT